jgi:hypothetical protein
MAKSKKAERIVKISAKKHLQFIEQQSKQDDTQLESIRNQQHLFFKYNKAGRYC